MKRKLSLLAALICLLFQNTKSQSDNAGGFFTDLPPLPTERMATVNVSLSDGRFLSIGGHGNNFVSLNSILIYNAGNYSELTIPYPADGCSASRLKDG